MSKNQLQKFQFRKLQISRFVLRGGLEICTYKMLSLMQGSVITDGERFSKCHKLQIQIRCDARIRSCRDEKNEPLTKPLNIRDALASFWKHPCSKKKT